MTKAKLGKPLLVCRFLVPIRPASLCVHMSSTTAATASSAAAASLPLNSYRLGDVMSVKVGSFFSSPQYMWFSIFAGGLPPGCHEAGAQ